MQLKLGKQRNKKNDTARLQLIEIKKKRETVIHSIRVSNELTFSPRRINQTLLW